MTKEQKLCDYLMAKHVGQDKAIHSKKLEKRFDICPRTVRTYVNIMIVFFASSEAYGPALEDGYS